MDDRYDDRSRMRDGGDLAPDTVGLPRWAVAVLGLGLFAFGIAVGSYGEFTRLLVSRGVSPDRAGLGMTLFLLGQLLIVLPADRLTRTRPVRVVAAIGLGLGAVGAAAPVLGSSLLVLLTSRLLLGLGQGIAFVGAMKYVGTRTARAQVATAQGLLGALFTLGLALALAIAPVLVALGGTALPAVITGVLAATAALATLRLRAVSRESARGIWSYLAPLRDPFALVLGLGNMATFGFLMVATTWYTAVFAGFDAFPVLPSLVLFAATTVLGRGLGGVLAPRFGDRSVVRWGLLGLGISLGLFTAAIATDSAALLVIATVGTGLGFSVPFGPLFGLAFSTLTEDAGVTLVVMLVIGNAGALAYPWLVGVLLGRTSGYTAGFGLMTVTVLGIFALWRATIDAGSTPK